MCMHLVHFMGVKRREEREAGGEEDRVLAPEAGVGHRAQGGVRPSSPPHLC